MTIDLDAIESRCNAPMAGPWTTDRVHVEVARADCRVLIAEVRRLQAQASRDSGAMLVQSPCYSTEAVDALVDWWDQNPPEPDLEELIETIRASREPRTSVGQEAVPADCPDCDYSAVDPGPGNGWERCTEPGCSRVHWVRYCEKCRASLEPAK